MSTAGGWDLAFAKAERAKRAFGIGALVIVALAVLGALLALRRAGFSHVSDDDFARTVIAEEWVAAVHGWPVLHELPAFRQNALVRVIDPSGTSWLPFPFWSTGAAMTLLGRSIAVAVAVQSAVLAGASVLLGRALRRARFGLTATACLLALGFANPYALWAGASQTPDAWTAVLLAAAMISLVEAAPDPWIAAGLLVATLSRYEAWPVAAVYTIRAVLARPSTRRNRLVGAAPMLGPLAWMAWNALAHGSPWHFFARVSSYREAHDPLPLASRFCFVPQAFVELLGPLLAGTVVIATLVVLIAPEARRRWWPVLAAAGALVAFLIAGSLGNGAPTHHPARALLACSWVGVTVALVGVQALMDWSQRIWGSKAGAWIVAGACFLGIFWAGSLGERVLAYPGRDESSRRDVQIARGLALQGRASLELTPCRYEYFALVAAYGAPERLTVRELPAAPGECGRKAP